MKIKIILLSVTILAFSTSLLFGQTVQPPLYVDPVAYEVYSAILSTGEAMPPKAKNFVIRRETLRNFGAIIDSEPPERICVRPDAESANLVGPAIDDFIKVNKTKWRLQEKFKLDVPYRLIDSETIISLIQPLTAQADWRAFYKQYPDSGGFIDLSAVGFNADKSVAIVSRGRWCERLCGEGRYYVLQKKDGKWIPLDWKGEWCSWVS